MWAVECKPKADVEVVLVQTKRPTGIFMDSLLNAIQWPAMAVTLMATWMVGSSNERYREKGFWCFMVSNVLWVVWGWHDEAYALIALQVGLFLLNIRGARKTEKAAHEQ